MTFFLVGCSIEVTNSVAQFSMKSSTFKPNLYFCHILSSIVPILTSCSHLLIPFSPPYVFVCDHPKQMIVKTVLYKQQDDGACLDVLVLAVNVVAVNVVAVVACCVFL